MANFIFGFLTGAALAAGAIAYAFRDALKAAAIDAWDKRMTGERGE
ncbi:MAG: hypothetical protein LBJ59_08135 [Zoogloeaceae bacterium]|jgi:hypothetical protein|nr:hypothetical protein [Zoogloeaceae bacterium]